MKRLTVSIFLLLFISVPLWAQRADLSGIKICIDPGHGGHNPANDRYLVPDPGTEFWESESNFQKALLLKALLEAKGASVILTRNTNDYPNDADEPSLSARWQLANANNATWFHSIHSNGFNGTVNYTLVLVKENISTRTAAFPQAVTMSNLIGPAIQSKLRNTSRSTYTYLDYTFYGGPNGGYNLGVLNGLNMPGELSEGSFHDYFPETRRLMNNSYRKMEAYAIRDAFLQYFGVPADSLSIIAGVQTNSITGKPVNGTKVRLLPENILYSGDNFNNGFYMFEGIQAGTHTIRLETPNVALDSIQIVVQAGTTHFVDRILTLTGINDPLASIPNNFNLYQNYPNPFNPSTTIEYDVPAKAFVRLAVYNTMGQEVANLVRAQPSAGRYTSIFDATNLSSGVYYYKLEAGGFVQTKKMILMK